MDNCSVFLLIW